LAGDQLFLPMKCWRTISRPVSAEIKCRGYRRRARAGLRGRASQPHAVRSRTPRRPQGRPGKLKQLPTSRRASLTVGFGGREDSLEDRCGVLRGRCLPREGRPKRLQLIDRTRHRIPVICDEVRNPAGLDRPTSLALPVGFGATQLGGGARVLTQLRVGFGRPSGDQAFPL
jgi:hypothetical protein